MTSSDLSYLVGKRIKMEPLSPSSVVRAGRKRNASQASLASSTSSMDRCNDSKKLKKYQMDPSSDPTVRNAIAAKANREKKKREEQQLKHDNTALKEQNLLLERQLKQVMEEKEELEKEIQQLKTQNSDKDQKTPDEYFRQLYKNMDPKIVNLPVRPEESFDGITTDPFEPVNDLSTVKLDDLGLSADFDLMDSLSPQELDEAAYPLFAESPGDLDLDFGFQPVEDPSMSKDPTLPRNLFGEYNDLQNLVN